MKKIKLLALIVLSSVSILAQKKNKIKGNKILESKTFDIKSYTTLDIGNEFKVNLIPMKNPKVSIEADSNLQEFIFINERDSILKVIITKELSRYKKLNLDIGYTQDLSKIIAKEKVKISSSHSIDNKRLTLETLDNANVDIRATTDYIDILSKGRSKINTKVIAKSLILNLSDNSKVTINADVENTNCILSLKSELSIEGKSNKFNGLFANSSYFYGASFIKGITNLKITDNSDAYINTADKLILEASGKSTTYLLGSPLIEIKKFEDETELKKIQKAPNSIRRLLK